MNEENELENGEFGNSDLENNEFSKMLDEFEQSSSTKGGLVKATIVDIKDDYVLLDTNQKTEKRMPVSEIQDANGNLLFGKNETIEVVYENNRLSYKKVIQKAKIKEFAKKLANNEVETNIKVVVVAKNKGGYVVEYEGMQFFMPRSLAILKATEDQIGKNISVKILKYEEENADSILVSRKHFLDNRTKELETKSAELIEAKESVQCRIEAVKNYGLFVEVQGIPSIIRYNELSYKGNINPQTAYEEGQMIDALPIKFDEKRKVLELSLKALQENPWDKIDNILTVNDVVKCKVLVLKPYGAFVNLVEQGVDALLHISELSWDRNIKHPEEKIAVGEEFDVKVIEINKENQQIKCSLKQLMEKPFDKFIQKYDLGDVVKGKVVHLTNFGAFVNIDFIDCLLLNVNCSWSRGDTCKKIFNAGDEVEVVIESLDKENNKIYVNRKKLLQSPADNFKEKYSVGQSVKGKVVAVKDFGIFVNVDDLLDIFIPKFEMSPEAKDVQIGDEVEARIIEFSQTDSKIKASMKEPREQEERMDFQSFEDNEKITIGNSARIKKGRF